MAAFSITLRFALALAFLLAVATHPVQADETDSESASEAEAEAEEAAPRRPSRLFRRPGTPRPSRARTTGRADPQLRRPGQPAPQPGEELEPALVVPDYEIVSVPDRWRIVEALGVNERWYDPYNQNTLKGDRPILGTQDLFLNLSVISDTVIEPRRLPIPVGAQLNDKPGSLDIFGDGDQLAINQNLIVSTALIKGDTVFRPPDYELRVTLVGNFNYTEVNTLGALRIDPARGKTRSEWDLGVQDLFIDKHLGNRSERYDFDSLRAGIQPFISDFRGFLFADNPLGVRMFGTFSNNRIQYNLAWFRRLDKNINSGLNDITELRDDDIFLANLYYQDFPVMGFTGQATVIYNRNREGDEFTFDENGFLQRPAPVGDARGHDYDVFYLGLNGDGHIDRLNLTFSAYLATGVDDRNPIAQRETTIVAGFFAAEASIDFDWQRYKLFGVYASGDSNPDDDVATGFDAIFENPQFAGADTSVLIRQSIPLIFGGGVAISGRNGMLPSLRTSKDQGQSNFVNPGLGMIGIGADWDVLPQLRLSANASWLTFMETDVLEKLRNQGRVRSEIGWDLSAAANYRPFFSQNIILRLSGAVLLPGAGLRDLFLTRGENPFYSILANLVLAY